ncbi:hypothetical protein [Tepidibacter mesophilus]|uniref:hypothetical protein n=1 Tax=Tepidibacter mesophilus TaxID=655607 RepID=UPI000C06B6AC|nr:hypothetical protein [Tepidibacter mesophilus]
MLHRLDEFLFDIMGIFVPGLITIAIFIVYPFSILPIEQVNPTFKKLLFYIKELNSMKFDPLLIFLVLFIICYILGHVIKVASNMYYQLGKSIVDNTIIDGLDAILENIKKYRTLKTSYNETPKNSNEKRIYMRKWSIVRFFVDNLLKIITFDAPSYDYKFENMYKDTKIRLKEEYGISYFFENREWYPFYKSGKIVSERLNIKTNTRQFLAKYNFYRSVSFIFICHTFYMILIGNKLAPNLMIAKYSSIIIGLDIILWITFHIKYKRYWTMCGNEAILGFYNSVILKEFTEKE